MPANFGDSVALIEAVALAGCWIWVQSRHLSYSDWKRKAALASFACVSVTAILYLLLTGVMHWIEKGNFRGNLYLGIFGVAILFALLSLVLGILGRGSP